MQAGKLRHRITIERPTDSKGATFGEVKLTWSTYKQVWASVEPLSGRETLSANQVVAGMTHRVVIRYLADVKPRMRVNCKGRYLNIVSVINKGERNIEMELMCEEEV